MYRQGKPTDWHELMKVSANSANDVIILGNSTATHERSDEEVLQVVLTLAALPQDSKVSGEVFAEMRLVENIDTLHALLPNVEGIIARPEVNFILCLCAVAPHVGHCLYDLASFTAVSGEDGNTQVYIRCVDDLPDLHGKTVAEASLSFPDTVLLGVEKFIE